MFKWISLLMPLDSKVKLFQFIENLDFERFKQSINKNPNFVNIRNENRETPLHAIINHSRIPWNNFWLSLMVKKLIENGANINAKNKFEKTPLELIAVKEDLMLPNKDTISLLLLFENALY